MSVSKRRFFREVTALVDSNVVVRTTGEKSYSGTLVGVNPDSLSLCLADAKDAEGKILHRICINGEVVSEILSVEQPFDLEALADRLRKVFPTMVDLYADKGFIWVMNKVKVTENGVVEGAGPAAERVKRVYDQFISDIEG
ncbi:MAG: Lsm family RNA-binding protein [Thermoproteota archaeon]